MAAGFRIYVVHGSRVFHTRRDCHYLAPSSRYSSRVLPLAARSSQVIRADVAPHVVTEPLRRCRRCVELDKPCTT